MGRVKEILYSDRRGRGMLIWEDNGLKQWEGGAGKKICTNYVTLLHIGEEEIGSGVEGH